MKIIPQNDFIETVGKSFRLINNTHVNSIKVKNQLGKKCHKLMLLFVLHDDDDAGTCPEYLMFQKLLTRSYDEWIAEGKLISTFLIRFSTEVYENMCLHSGDDFDSTGRK